MALANQSNLQKGPALLVDLIATNIFAAGLLSDDENDRRVVHQSWLRRRGNDPMIGFAMNRFAVSHYVCPPNYPAHYGVLVAPLISP